MTLKGISFTI